MADVLPPDSNADPTDVERDALRRVGLGPDRDDPQWHGTTREWFNDYGGSSLVQAYRAGYADARGGLAPDGDDILSPDSVEAPTDREVAALAAVGLGPDRGCDEWFNDYDGSALLRTYRAGHADGSPGTDERAVA